jgi:hypothetical protein
MDQTKSSGVINMNYIYKFSNYNSITEINTINNSNLSWSINSLKESLSDSEIKWLESINFETEQHSFLRVKKWVIKNHPEILI